MQMNRPVQFILYSNFHTIIPVAGKIILYTKFKKSVFKNVILYKFNNYPFITDFYHKILPMYYIIVRTIIINYSDL